MELKEIENKASGDVIAEIVIEDIIERLLDLQAYSRNLSQRADTELEAHLPEYPVPHFVQKIKAGLNRIINSKPEEKEKACSDFEETLRASYVFYLSRLAVDSKNNWWSFRFPDAFECTHAAVYTHQ